MGVATSDFLPVFETLGILQPNAPRNRQTMTNVAKKALLILIPPVNALLPLYISIIRLVCQV